MRMESVQACSAHVHMEGREGGSGAPVQRTWCLQWDGDGLLEYEPGRESPQRWMERSLIRCV
ncbi:hypothetical protein GCM10025857_34490 [Alicyclobacillus contaminans]|uniref:hypothetical protein n=1 Tax=Alicyclobacillus contaminans TaxID=392016 RepID=UPI00040CFD77|nr:hypothetical protein [Alicyclobacillus contaminans]GMA52092.1 hypothetical protein GCM10025857_34490 [Alicyclobacillus contaminans]